MDLTLSTAEGMLNVRVAAVILSNNKILVEQGCGVNYAVCPGGRVAFGESANCAIEREFNRRVGRKTARNPSIVSASKFFCYERF